MPPGFTGTCAGSPTARRARSRPRRSNLGPRRAGLAELPRLELRSARRTSPRAPAATRSTRWGRCTWPGRSRARRSRSWRSPRRWRAPMTTASSSSGSPCTSIRSTPTSSRPPTRSPRSSAASRSGCARSRSTSTSPTSRSTRPTATRRSRSTPRGSGTRARSPTSPRYFQVVNCARLAFKPKMTMRQLGGRKATRRASNPACRFDLSTRAGDANIKSLSVTLSHAFEIDQRHLGNICSEKELVEKQCAGRTPIGKAIDEDSAARPAAQRPGLRGLGLGRPAAAGLHPQRPGQPGAARRHRRPSGGRLKTTVPVVPDAPIGHFSTDRLRRQDRLPDQHPQHLLAQARRRGRLRRPERQDHEPEGQGQDSLREDEEEGKRTSR